MNHTDTKGLKKIDMGFIGLAISLLAVACMIIGLIPFLGWLNWFTTLPLAILGGVINTFAFTRFRSKLAVTGLLLCGIALAVGIIRLLIGCGIF